MANMEFPMSKKSVIFGTGTMASLAWYCLTQDSHHSVNAFTVNKAYLKKILHEGLPVLAFEELEKFFPVGSTNVLIAAGYSHMNSAREKLFLQVREKGYEIISYVSSRASIWPDLQINQNTIIFEHSMVQPFSSIGENTIIRCNVCISHHCKIGNHVFIANGVTLGGNVTVGDRSFIGLTAAIRDGIKIAEGTFIGAGSVVLADTEPDGVYVGNPARKLDKKASDLIDI
jgi:sugar O-acyltransferase (sialic acid O-acetyltransferase NeuD family)